MAGRTDWEYNSCDEEAMEYHEKRSRKEGRMEKGKGEERGAILTIQGARKMDTDGI